MGTEMPATFRGMFAFALLDQCTGSLFLARDQFGIKPLHYICRKDGVVFASEIKALVSVFGSELQILHVGTRRLNALLLGARPNVLVVGCRQAPARYLGRIPTRWHAPYRAVLGHRRRGSCCSGGSLWTSEK